MTRLIFLLKEYLLHPRSFLSDECARSKDVVDARDGKLRRLLSAAVRDVPFYRDLAANGTIDAANPQLEQFPILTKADVRDHEERFVSDRHVQSKLSVCRTSGSTGEPFKFYRDPKEFDATYADLWRGLARLGIRRGDKRALVKGVDEVPVVSRIVRLRRWLYGVVNRCMVIDAHFLARSGENVRKEIGRLQRYRPVYIHGYVSSIDLIAAFAEREGIDLKALRLKAIVTESEKLYDFQRERMERVFGCRVAENYGSVEFGMIAQPDPDGNLCINETHCLVETDSDGSAVLTNLDAYAFPFIRFKNGDMLTLRKEKKSRLPYREIEMVEGRVADTIHLPNDSSLQGFIVMYPVSKHMKYIKAYQIRQTQVDSLDVLLVLSEPLPDAIRDQILREMREIVGDGVAVVVKVVDDIPLTSRGKRRFVYSEIRREKELSAVGG